MSAKFKNPPSLAEGVRGRVNSTEKSTKSNKSTESTQKKVVFSGIQPTGSIHIGNYFGAIKSWVANQNIYENIFCVANSHAITVRQRKPCHATKWNDKSCRYATILWHCA